jgi:uncharacterized membrane protein (DUF4010 family)
MTEAQESFYFLGVALAIGLLIGLERGWHEREAEEGSRIAGVRTYGLIGLLGGVVGLLAGEFGQLLLGLGFIGLAGAVTTAYVLQFRAEGDIGITSLAAVLLTFALGALAASGEVALASAASVVTTLLLSYKPLLHEWVGALEAKELQAGIKLLLISVVLLPVLPNQGYGPWDALNPHAIWWMVVLVAAISFTGYFAVKLGGTRRGALFTGIFGGLASSTALTLHFSRSAKKNAGAAPLLSMGILLACGTMFPRMVLVATVLSRDLLLPLAVPGAVMASCVYLPAFFYWRQEKTGKADMKSPLKNPLELKAALSFGVLLAAVLLLGKALQDAFGEAGVLALAAASGITDVDAITLSLARMTSEDLALRTATLGIVIAAAVNSVTKGAMAAVIGGPAVGLRVGAPLAVCALAGLLATWLWVW